MIFPLLPSQVKRNHCLVNWGPKHTNQTDWQIRINHELHWYFPKGVDINLFQFAQPLCVCSINKEIKKIEEKKVKEKAQKAQEDLLDTVFEIFKNNPNQSFGPASITKVAGLFKGLNNGTQNDRIAQGFINELLNRDKIKKVSGGGYQIKASH